MAVRVCVYIYIYVYIYISLSLSLEYVAFIWGFPGVPMSRTLAFRLP